MKQFSLPLSRDRKSKIFVHVPLDGLGKALSLFVPGRRVFVVSTPPVFRRYGSRLRQGLTSAGFQVAEALMPNGEKHKTLETVKFLYGRAVKAGVDRKSVLIALGGGVVGDTAGYVAATYLRGIPLVQCPTTLLAMVDSSIGGKTGVDLPDGKNLVGAFHQPLLVWMDLATLGTLPDRQWRTGMAEVIKYGLIGDPRLLAKLEVLRLSNLKKDRSLQEDLVARSVAIKVRVVSRDERETLGVRELLNLGHTFGHALETVTGYRCYTHGEAVGVGLCAATRLAVGLNLVPEGCVARVQQLVARWGLPTRALDPLPRAKILAAMRRDKKTVNGVFRFVVPDRWGRSRAVGNVDKKMVLDSLAEVGL